MVISSSYGAAGAAVSEVAAGSEVSGVDGASLGAGSGVGVSVGVGVGVLSFSVSDSSAVSGVPICAEGKTSAQTGTAILHTMQTATSSTSRHRRCFFFITTSFLVFCFDRVMDFNCCRCGFYFS